MLGLFSIPGRPPAVRLPLVSPLAPARISNRPGAALRAEDARFLSRTDSGPGPWGRFELLLTLRGCLPGGSVVGGSFPARAAISGGSTGSGFQPTITAISSPAPRLARIARLVCGIGQRSGLSGPLGVAVTEAVVSRRPLVCSACGS